MNEEVSKIDVEQYWRLAMRKPQQVCDADKTTAAALRYFITDLADRSLSTKIGLNCPVISVNFLSHLTRYSDLMRHSGEKGINNYAEEVLPLIANQRNDSDSWVSSLDFTKYAHERLVHGLDPIDVQIPAVKCVVEHDQDNLPFPTASTTRFYSNVPVELPIHDAELTRNTRNIRNRPAMQTHATLPTESDEKGNLDEHPQTSFDSFRTAKEQLMINNAMKNKQPLQSKDFGNSKKSLGPRRGPGRFVPPIQQDEADMLPPDKSGGSLVHNITRRVCGGSKTGSSDNDMELPEELSHLDPKIVELILSEIMDTGTPLTWSDIAGLEFAKKTIKEIIVLPMLRPDIFTGLRGPPKGLLLFGPPGTGKTLIGKCVASQSKCTFFSISASSLTSKWVGEGEKMVRTLFAVARYKQPSVVFIDEIDSLLTQRSESEHESSRRIKTEFLVQMDGVGCNNEDKLLIIGATNRPQELDEAARRRFVKRLYIPLPEPEARKAIVENMMRSQCVRLTESDVMMIIKSTGGYSGADMANLCKEAALGPVRDIAFEDIETVTLEQVRPICIDDFKSALRQVKASVASTDLRFYLEWNSQFGSWDIPKTL